MQVQNINNHLFLALIHAIKKVKSVNVDKGFLEREVVDEILIINHYQEKSWQQLPHHPKISISEDSKNTSTFSYPNKLKFYIIKDARIKMYFIHLTQ